MIRLDEAATGAAAKTKEGVPAPRILAPVALVGALLLTALAWDLASPLAAQEATPADSADCPATTPEENEALVAQFYELFHGDIAAIADLVADDFVYNHPSGEEMADAEPEGWIGDRQEDYGDLQVTTELVVAEGDMVAAYVSWAGTHQDEEENLGVPATGLETEWVGAGFFRIECGQIAEVWSVSDSLGRLRALGVITDEELQSAETVATPMP